MAVTINGTTGIDTPSLTADTTTLVVDETNNRVGIGTSSPDSKLTVANVNSWHDGVQIRRDTPGDQYLALGYDIGVAYIAAVDETPAAAGDGQTISFGRSSDGSTFTEAMRLDSSSNLQFNSGYGSVATAYGCRAWVNFNGTTNTGGNCDIRGSGGVSSVTDNGVGDYLINLSVTMPDLNYAVTASGNDDGTNSAQGIVCKVKANQTTSQARVRFTDLASFNLRDNNNVNVAVYR